MDINKLHHFRAVVESQSLRRASELLAISPGALSKSLRVFQEELGLKLLEQEGRGIVITEKGNDLYRKSSRLMEEVTHLKRNLSQEEPREIRFGTYEVFSTHFLASFLEREKVENLSCDELTPGIIEEALVDRKIDYGLTLIPFPHKDLDHLVVANTEMKIYCKEGGEFFNKQIDELKFAVPMTELSTNPSNSIAIDSWPENMARKINYRFNMLETALQTCSKDLSVVYAPEITVKSFNQGVSKSRGLVEHSYKKANKMVAVYLVKRKESEETQFCKKLSKFLRQL